MVAANSLTPEYIDLAVPANQIQEKLPELASQRTVIPATKDIARSASAVVAQSRAYIQNNPDALDSNAKRELVDAAQKLAALCGQLAQAGKDWVRSITQGELLNQRRVTRLFGSVRFVAADRRKR